MPMPEFFIKHDKKHKWDNCGMCGLTVYCGTCGLNMCSGGSGRLPDGSDCPDCASAYEFYDYYVEEAKTFYADILAEIELKRTLDE